MGFPPSASRMLATVMTLPGVRWTAAAACGRLTLAASCLNRATMACSTLVALMPGVMS